MTIGDILGTIKNLGTKVTGSLGSILSSPTPTAPAKPLTVGDWFAPKTIPETISMPKIAGIPLEMQQNAARTASELVAAGRKAVAEYPAKVAAANAERFPQGTELVTGTPEQKKVAMGKLFNLAGGFVGGTNPFTGFTAAENAGARTIGNSLLPMVQSAGTKIETAITDMVNAVTPRAANAVLLKLGMAPEVATKIAPAIAKTTTPKEVVGVLRSIQPKTPEVAPVKPTVAQGSTGLAQEAVKYGSSKEFQDALNIPYQDREIFGIKKNPNANELMGTFKGYGFHGTNAIDSIQKNGYKPGEYFNSGVYFSDTPDVAIDYAKQNRTVGGKATGVIATDLSKLKIKDIPYEQFRQVNKGYGEGETLVNDLKNKKYDGIRSEGETLVWNTGKLSKPQTLEDIWKQGQTATPKAATPAKTPATDVTLYRAGETTDPQGRGIFLSQNEATAQAYQNTGAGGKTVTPYTLSGDANMKDAVNRWQLVKELDPTGAGMAEQKAAQIAPDLAQASTKDEVTAILRGKGTPAPKLTPSEPVASQGGGVADPYVYHTTSLDNLKSIGDKGLAPSKKGQYGPGTYFAPTEDKTLGYGSREGVMLRVNREKLPSDFQEWPGEQGWTPQGIPNSAIEYKLKGDTTWKPVTTVSKVIDGQVVEKAVAPVTRETPKVVQGAQSVGELLAQRGADLGGGKPPRVPRETTGPIPGATPPERRFITRTKEMAPEAAPLLKGQYARRATEPLIQEADKIIALDRTEAARIATTEVDDRAVAVASRLIETYVKEARGAASEGAAKEIWEKAADIANASAKNLTENGRAVQAASILGKLTPEGAVRDTARMIQKYNENAGMSVLDRMLKGVRGLPTKKIPELSGEQAKYIIDEMTRIQGLTNPEEKAIAQFALDRKLQEILPSTAYQHLVAFWKAGLLTGVPTHALNIGSNAVHGVSEIVKDVPGSAVDIIASLFSGKRTLALTTRGIPTGFVEGIKKGWRLMKTGYDERNAMGKIDYKVLSFGKGKIAQAVKKYEDTVFHLLGAEDQPFYYAAKARSLFSQAIAQAKNEGLKGAERAARINEIIANPTDRMIKYSVLDAQTAVFQNPTALGKLASGFQKLPGGEILLPFGKTPSAVAMQMFNYSPVGVVSAIIKGIRTRKAFDQRLFSQAMGRGITGTGVLAIGAALFTEGLMTTTRPSGEKEQKQWQLEGKIPNAIFIAGKWRNVGVLGPLGQVLAVGAHIQQGVDETGTFSGGLGAAAGGALSSLSDQTFLSGINSTLNVMSDPARYGNTFVSNLAGSVVPTIIANVARATDTFERRSTDPMSRVASRIPGLRQFLQPQVDTFGTKIETPNFFTVMADPTRPATATADANDPVVLELRRLSDAGFPATPTMLGGTQGFKSLSEKQNNQLWEIGGQFAKMKVQETMNNPRYRSWDDEQKAKKINSAVDDSKTEARARVIYYATKGLSGAELNKALSTYKADKLLTKAVYTRYKEIIRFGK